MRNFIKNDIERILGDIKANFEEGVALFCQFSTKKGLVATFQRYTRTRIVPSRIYNKLSHELGLLKNVSARSKEVDDEVAPSSTNSAFQSPKPIGVESSSPYRKHAIPPHSPDFIKNLFNEYKRIIAKRTHLHTFLFEEVGKSDEEVYEYQVEILMIAKRENEIWEAINAYKSQGTIKVSANEFYKMAIQDAKNLQSLSSKITQAKSRLKKAVGVELKKEITVEIDLLTKEKEALKNKINGN